MIDKTQRLNESLDSFLTEYKEKNEGNKYRPVAVGRYGIRTRESIYSKELAKDYSKNKLIFKNTLTVGMGSTQIDIGVLSEDATYAVSPAYHTYRIHDINSDYLRYCLECRNQDMFVRYVKRGSRQGKSIDLKRWITYKIPVYPESVQAEIVKRLDSVKAILSLREQELNALDDLIKARFAELFGDTFSNPKRWPTKTFREASLRLSDGPFGSNLKSEHYSENGVRVIRLGNIGVGKFIDKDQSYVSLDHYARLKKYTCKPGEIVIGTLGEPNLRACIIPDYVKLAVNKADCVHYVPDSKILENTFVCQYINCPTTLLLASNMVHGQTRARVSSGQIAKMPIFIPPLSLQQQFADFVAQIDKSKATVQKALDETQLLFDSLMQQYFG